MIVATIFVLGVLRSSCIRILWETGDFPPVTCMEFVGCQPGGADSLNVKGVGEILVLSDTEENPFESGMVSTGSMQRFTVCTVDDISIVAHVQENPRPTLLSTAPWRLTT